MIIIAEINAKQYSPAYWFEVAATKQWTVKVYAESVRALYLPCELSDNGVAKAARKNLRKVARGRLNDAARHFVIGWGLLLARKAGV